MPGNPNDQIPMSNKIQISNCELGLGILLEIGHWDLEFIN